MKSLDSSNVPTIELTARSQSEEDGEKDATTARQMHLVLNESLGLLGWRKVWIDNNNRLFQ